MIPKLVSFIIPNYNHAHYVRFAIDSALAQTYPHIEIIVVDDGSKDDSRAVLESYGDRIRTIFQANAGLSGARNSGVAAAQGEFIALLDADDTVEPAYLERLLAALAEHPEAQGVYCGFRFVDQDDRALSQVENRIVAPQTLYAAMLIDGNFWVPESLLARAQCYHECGEFDTGQRFVEDWDVWLRFAQRYTIVGIPDVLVRYRVVPGSLWCNPQGNLHGRLRVLDKHLGGAPATPGAELIHRAYASAYFRAVIEYLMVDDAESSYACLVAAANVYPDLLVDHATFYELYCGGQERGERGSMAGLDITARSAQVAALIDRLAADGALTNVQTSPSSWRGQALWALAQLQYRAGDTAAARGALLAALRQDSSLTHNRAFTGLLARSLVGARSLALLKRITGRQATSAA